MSVLIALDLPIRSGYSPAAFHCITRGEQPQPHGLASNDRFTPARGPSDPSLGSVADRSWRTAAPSRVQPRRAEARPWSGSRVSASTYRKGDPGVQDKNENRDPP